MMIIVNTERALAKSNVGISLLQTTGAQAPLKRFFCACFMVGCAGALSSAPFPVDGKANPVQSITLGLASDGDGFMKPIATGGSYA